MRRALSFADDAAADAFTRQRASFVARHAADTHYDVSERYEIEDVALHGRAGGDWKCGNVQRRSDSRHEQAIHLRER